MGVADVLSRAADLIEPEGAWIQGDFGRDADGKSTGLSRIEDAICFCVAGATERASGDDMDLSCEADSFVAKLINGKSVSEWNDAEGRTQSEVVAKLREAATLAASVQS